MKIAEVMSANPYILTSEQTLREAASLFNRHKIDGAPVVNGRGEVVGLLGKTHLFRAIEDETDFDCPIKEVMTNNVITVDPDDDIEYFNSINRGRLPVVRDDVVVGVVTKSDLASLYNKRLENIYNEQRAVIDSTYNGIISIDKDLNIRIFNNAAEQIFNMNSSDVIGKPYFEAFPEGTLADIIKFGSTEKSRKLFYKDRALIANRTPILDNGEIVGAVAVIQDISDMESTLIELKQTRQRQAELDAALEASLDSFFITDATGKILNVNDAYTKMTGIRADDILGRSIYELQEEGYYNRAATIMVLESGKPVSYTEKTRTGKTALFIGTPIYNDEGQLINVLVNIHDVSELESVSNELEYVKSLKEELDAVIEASFDGIFITDGNATVVRINEAYTRITGFTSEELVGQNMRELIQKGYFDRSAALAVIEGKKPVTITQTVKNGKTLLVTGNPIFNERGELITVLANCRDLTELNDLKEQMEKAHSLQLHYEEELRRIKMQVNENYIVGSQKSRDVIDLLLRLGKVDSIVLIQGESGSGKELVAQELHDNSIRRDKPFIRINCAAIPESLLESELFGYEEGAFTGAQKGGKMGIYEMANEGTLFLDEIGELPLSLQAKLLRVLQDGEVTRLGGTKSKKVDVRLIAATNKDLQEMVKNKQFREDLFYRLNVVPIFVPPLRERKEEIPALVNYFLHVFNEKYNLNKSLDRRIMNRFMDYSWPGNIRELKNIIERLVVTTEENIISEFKLPDSPGGIKALYPFPYINEEMCLKDAVERFEKEYIVQYIEKYGSTRKTARVLGVSQSTIWRKAIHYGIELKEK